MRRFALLSGLAAWLSGAGAAPARAQQPPATREVQPAPDRGPSEGEGPFPRIIIRGATVIDGTGAPAQGPMDIVIEGNRIVELRNVGSPGAPLPPDRRPQTAGKEIDATGMYVLPGFVDLHGHEGGSPQ